MGEKLRYSDKELKVFEEIILEKLEKSKKELDYIKASISRKNDEGSDNSTNNTNVMEDSADATEKENLNQLAGRQIKFIQQLENALVYDSSAAYIYVSLVSKYSYLNHWKKALSCALKAAEYSPNWVYAQYIVGNVFQIFHQRHSLFCKKTTNS